MFEYHRVKASIYQLLSALGFALFLYFVLVSGLVDSQFKDATTLNNFILTVITDPILLLALAFVTIRDIYKYIKNPTKTIPFDAVVYKKMMVAFSIILGLVLLYNLLFIPHLFITWLIAIAFCLFILINKLIAAYLFKCR